MRRNRKLDRLWRLWYALLVLLLQAFLLYAAACRYLDYRQRAMRESWRQEPMNCYLAAILSAACLATLFAYASFARTGNFADDGVSMGRDPASLRLAMLESGAASTPAPTSCTSRMRRHFLPPTCGLHLLMALCLLAPLPALEAEAVLHEEAPREAIWFTSLDFLLRDHRSRSLLTAPDETPMSSSGTGVSAEVANLILALCLLLVRYPSAFWLASRPFSLLFSGVLCACCIHVLLSREASAVLLRSAMVGDNSGCLPAAAVPALQIISDLMLLTACVAFFEFGYGRVLSSLRQLRPYLQQQQKQQQQQRLLHSKQPDHLDSVSNYGVSGVGPSSDYSSHQAGQAACCQRGILAAQVLGSLLMLAAGLIKAPLLWDWLVLYRRRRVPVLLAAIASGGAYAVVWTGAWLLIGLCRGAAACQFAVRVELPRDVAEQEELEEIDDDSSAAAAAGGISALRGIDGDGNPCVDGMVSGQSPSQRRQQQQQSVQSPYMYHHHQQQFRIGEGVGMIPTISERVDTASEDGGASGSGGSSGAGSDKLSGLVKYQVRRDSSGGSLKRSPGGGSASHSRVVTFKESINGVSSAPPPQLSFLASTASPASSQVGGASSSDSGVADYQLHLLHQHHQHHQHQAPLFAAFGGGHEAVATYATRSEIFAPTFPPPPPPPPPLSSTLMSTSSASTTASVSTRVPDILMTRCGQFQQQQEQQQLQGHGSLGRGIRKPISLFGRQLSSELLEMLPPPPSPPPPPLPPSQQLLQHDAHMDGLCSQV